MVAVRRSFTLRSAGGEAARRGTRLLLASDADGAAVATSSDEIRIPAGQGARRSAFLELTARTGHPTVAVAPEHGPRGGTCPSDAGHRKPLPRLVYDEGELIVADTTGRAAETALLLRGRSPCESTERGVVGFASPVNGREECSRRSSSDSCSPDLLQDTAWG